MLLYMDDLVYVNVARQAHYR